MAALDLDTGLDNFYGRIKTIYEGLEGHEECLVIAAIFVLEKIDENFTPELAEVWKEATILTVQAVYSLFNVKSTNFKVRWSQNWPFFLEFSMIFFEQISTQNTPKMLKQVINLQ